MSDTPETDMFAESDAVPACEKWSAFARLLERSRDALERRVTELESWKAQQLAVEAEWDPQEVGRMLGMPLGASIRKEIQPRIQQLLNKLASTSPGNTFTTNSGAGSLGCFVDQYSREVTEL